MEFVGKLKYVGLELMKKNAKSTDTPEVGLFRGLRSRVEGDVTLSLVLLGDEGNPDSIRGLNVDVFNVMTILLKYGETREMIVFKNTEADQKEAGEMIDAIVEKLKTDNLMLDSDPDIVDSAKYVEIDADFFGVKPKKTGVVGGTGTTHTPVNNDWKKKQEAEKKEKERQEKLRWTPFSMARKSDKPMIKDLNLIKKKVVALSTGEYDGQLPHLAGDPPEEEDKKTQTTTK